MDRVRVGQAVGDQGVAAFVVGDALLLVLVDDALLLFQAGGDALDPFVELLHADRVFPLRAASSAASLTRLARSAPTKPDVMRGDVLKSHGVVELHVLHVDFQNLFAAAHVGPIDQHVAVESSGTQQRRIERFGPVGGGHHDHAAVGAEAVHLDQQRVQRLLALVMAADDAGAARFAQRVELVDEDDAGGLGLGLLEHVADARGADADEHLDKVRARQAEERHARLAGDGLGQQGLAGARRPDQQDAFGNAAAQDLIFFGVRKNSTTSRSSSTASSMPATSSNVTPMSSWAYILPRLRPKAIGLPAPPRRRIIRKKASTNNAVTIRMGA